MTEIAARPAPGSRSIIALIVDKLVALCAVIPYALVALGLRLVMARIFFLLRPRQDRRAGHPDT